MAIELADLRNAMAFELKANLSRGTGDEFLDSLIERTGDAADILDRIHSDTSYSETLSEISDLTRKRTVEELDEFRQGDDLFVSKSNESRFQKGWTLSMAILHSTLGQYQLRNHVFLKTLVEKNEQVYAELRGKEALTADEAHRLQDAYRIDAYIFLKLVEGYGKPVKEVDMNSFLPSKDVLNRVRKKYREHLSDSGYVTLTQICDTGMKPEDVANISSVLTKWKEAEVDSAVVRYRPNGDPQAFQVGALLTGLARLGQSGKLTLYKICDSLAPDYNGRSGGEVKFDSTQIQVDRIAPRS